MKCEILQVKTVLESARIGGSCNADGNAVGLASFTMKPMMSSRIMLKAVDFIAALGPSSFPAAGFIPPEKMKPDDGFSMPFQR